jgi:hypothetical protein
MTNEEIKDQTDRLYKVIENAKRILDEIREECPHEQIDFNVDYMWRVGNVCKANICHFCGKALKSFVNL